MLSMLGAPQQHKQPSRKGKKAWRKNVDITAVQDGLETLREEIIQGGPVAEKESQDLFVVDTTGGENIKKAYKLQKPLKADEILAKRSAVESVDSRKRPNSRVTDGILQPASKRYKADWVSKKEVQRLKEVVQGGSQLTTSRLEEDESPAFDLWGINGTSEAPAQPALDYIPKPRAKVAPQSLRKAPTPLTANGKAVRAVRNPESGTSYNPTFEDWDNLLMKEGQKEVEAEKTRRREADLEAEKQTRLLAAAAAAEERGDRTDEESAWEGFETETEGPLVLSKKRPGRKTPAQRNKIKRRKEAERLARHEQKMGGKQKTAAQIEAALEAAKEKAVAMTSTEGDGGSESESGDDRVLRRRRLGNTAIQEKPLELVLPDELQDSLRRLKPEGNLLNDRFRNLLVNGKIEARKLILQPKKKRRTYTEKWSYKDFSVEV
jgi:Nop53 (60S ribosomal biogenesis)